MIELVFAWIFVEIVSRSFALQRKRIRELKFSARGRVCVTQDQRFVVPRVKAGTSMVPHTNTFGSFLCARNLVPLSFTMAATDDSSSFYLAAVEGGGTSFKVAVCQQLANSSQVPTILHRTEIDSSGDPHACLTACSDFLRQHKPECGYDSLAIATFGPVGVRRDQPYYGCILSTSPKASWRGVNLLKPLQVACKGTKPLVVRVETDVNAPALAEYQQAIATVNPNMTSVAYITVGTGIGVGLVVNGKCVHGRMHPEGGHVPVQPLSKDTFQGYSWGVDSSPFRGIHTVEGIASSVALTERLEQRDGKKYPRDILKTLSDDDEVWDHAANALACLCVTLLLTLSIEKIVIGGGLMNRRGLMDKIRKRTVELVNGYLELPTDMATLIATSSFGQDAGLMGAVVLAQEALRSTQDTVEKREKEMKQVAFGHGLWHGMIVGALGTALIVKYVLYGRSSGRR